MVDAAPDFVACIAERTERSAVNIVSRMESHGETGRINLSAFSYDLIREQHPCDYLGKVDMKGKGEIDMYCVAPKAG